MRHNLSCRIFLILLTVLAFTASGSAQREAGGAIAAIDEAVGANFRIGAAAPQTATSSKTSAKKPSTPKRKTVRTASGTSVAAVKKWNGFVVGDKYSFLNFEVVSAVKPYHTRDAKAGGASGLVQVEVLIDQFGNVLTAKARTGNKLLHPEAERAAIESRFNKPEVYGKPARAIGFLVYRFGPAED